MVFRRNSSLVLNCAIAQKHTFLRVFDDLLLCVRSGNAVVLVLLDLTAVFGTVDHDILTCVWALWVQPSSSSSLICQAELCPYI